VSPRNVSLGLTMTRQMCSTLPWLVETMAAIRLLALDIGVGVDDVLLDGRLRHFALRH
jgi:hypothetical protein